MKHNQLGHKVPGRKLSRDVKRVNMPSSDAFDKASIDCKQENWLLLDRGVKNKTRAKLIVGEENPKITRHSTRIILKCFNSILSYQFDPIETIAINL